MANRRVNGDGTFHFFEASGLWQYRYTVPGRYDKAGRPVRLASYGKTKPEAKKKGQEKLNQYLTGTKHSPSQITLKELGERVINDKLRLNKVQPQTAAREKETLKMMKSIYNRRISTIKPADIQEFLEKDCMKYSDGVIIKIFTLLGHIFKAAVKDEIIGKSPMDKVERPRSKKVPLKVRGLSLDEHQKLLKVLLNEDILYSEAMLLSLYTGMRMGEVLALELSDIDFKKKTISINKTMASDEKGAPFVNGRTKTQCGMRTILMDNDTIRLLKSYIKSRDKKVDKSLEDVLFIRNGKRIGRSQVYCVFKRMLETYDIITPVKNTKIDLHSLRHTYATRCIEGGMNIKVLQQRLGHKDITTTYNTYADVFEKFEEENLAKTSKYLQKNGLSMFE